MSRREAELRLTALLLRAQAGNARLRSRIEAAPVADGLRPVIPRERCDAGIVQDWDPETDTVTRVGNGC